MERFIDHPIGKLAVEVSGQIAGLAMLLQDKGIATEDEVVAYLEKGKELTKKQMEGWDESLS